MVVSHDGGDTWTPALPPDANTVNLEGAIHELKDGTILALDTYVVPGDRPDSGVGQLYISKDEYRTQQGPIGTTFSIPHADFCSSTDDKGRPYGAERLHRRIVELPGGDLLIPMYGLLKGDNYRSRVLKPLAGSLCIPKLNFQVIRRTIATRARNLGSVKDIHSHLCQSRADTTANEYMQDFLRGCSRWLQRSLRCSM